MTNGLCDIITYTKTKQVGRIKMFRDIIKEIQENPEKYSPEEAAMMLFNASNRTFPLEIIDIATKMEFSTFFVEDLEKENSGSIGIDTGLVDIWGSDKVMLIKKDMKSGKRRFVLAHELAHYLFDFNERKQLTYYNAYNKCELNDSERRANAFAACLLMPAESFKKEFERLITEDLPRRIIADRLSDTFEVTPKAADRRMVELGLYDK